MNTTCIALNAEEQALLARINFDSLPAIHDSIPVRAIGAAARDLMQLLIKRKAIPEVRFRFFTDPAFNIGGRGLSRLQIFEKNGTSGDAIFRHPHFLEYLRYFLYGPDLPANMVEAFKQRIVDCGEPVTSGDIIPLGHFARQQTRAHRLETGRAAEEFYKLALDCGLDASEARSIRDAVKKVR